MKSPVVSLATINQWLRRIGVVFVVSYDTTTNANHRFWIERWSSYQARTAAMPLQPKEAL